MQTSALWCPSRSTALTGWGQTGCTLHATGQTRRLALGGLEASGATRLPHAVHARRADRAPLLGRARRRVASCEEESRRHGRARRGAGGGVAERPEAARLTGALR